MKNLTKHLLAFLLFSFVMNFSVRAQRNISVFGTPVTLDAPIVMKEFPTGFPLSIGASHLRNCKSRQLASGNIQALFNASVSSLNMSNLPNGVPVMAAFFTTEYDGDTLNVILNKTHGLCFAFYDQMKITFYYFEKNENGKFDWVQNLTTRIHSFNQNMYISLHYSHFSPGSFPDKSTVFSFLCESIGKVEVDESEDIAILLSKDMKRQTGLYSLGMADSLILAGCETPNGGSSACNEPCETFVPNASCEYASDDDGFLTYICKTDMGFCIAGATIRRIREENLNTGIPIKFKMMRDFRDKFMSKYCEGRKYTGFYYAFSKYAKLNVALIWKYVSVLPELYAAMENLSDESSDKIIVTPSLREKILEILHDHNDVGDAYFQSILSKVEADLDIFTGLKRSEVISMLSPYGSCNGGRTALNGEGSGNSYFATAYYNPVSEDINVNCSVPGTGVKFELFNATAGLLISSNVAPQQKNLKVTTKTYGPGIYIYRISSDSGYEKTGKLVIVK